MRLKHMQKMVTGVEQLMLDPQSRFLEMKSLQPYSTTDEYLYAMKEDLADWLSTMYPEWRPITADNFVECLENGVLLCQHANNVNSAARKSYSSKLSPPSMSFILENCKYRSDARPQTFNARDNVSQFIKWARRVGGVREVLMFESDDLILRKNEKNFLLCLLEIARYGAQFGVSVPAIIKLEDEIEREIERDKQSEIMSFTELRRLQREENQKNNSLSSSHLGKYSKLLKFVRHDISDSNHHQETTKNIYNTFSLSHSNGASWLRQRISRIPKFTTHNNKKRHNSGESNDSTTCSEATTTIVSTKEQYVPQISRTLGEGEMKIETPTISSQLHKTVEQMTNSCCCAQRFPVKRIGEGKYRIGESGTVIFIRILRYHVMVRVGGGWDTLENYLNKHDPCRRMGGHRRLEHHDHHTDIPIRAVSNQTNSSAFSKTISHGRSVTLKTEDFPLTKPIFHDANLANAQLVITRDPDGRHHIGQITYKSEENLHLQQSCRHHHHPHQNPQSPVPKIRSARGTGHSTLSPTSYKQSSPSTDQDYSSYLQTFSTETKPSSILPNENQSNGYCRTDFVLRQPPTSKMLNDNHKENQHNSRATIKSYRSGFVESIIDNIDGYITPNLGESEQDFDISDIDDAMRSHNHDHDTTQMDEDSLESAEGVLETTKHPAFVPPPTYSAKTPSTPKAKSGGICTALYLAQKQKQIAAFRKTPTMTAYSRSNTLPNVNQVVKNEEKPIIKTHRKPTVASQRSQSTDLFEKTPYNDISKLDRDSGFDEQDFRCERLHSSYDDNSSISSLKSARNSIGRSLSSDLNGQTYRENKAYELRLKALDHTRFMNEQSAQDPRLQIRRNFNYLAIRAKDTNCAATHIYKKNAHLNLYFKC
ncbi:unnamed protein product [Adineta ricciae]|uniref:GAS2-like protein 1 n=1 Tax=Adineta ricciae TaxID=249248 RepID=A0A814GDB0_ADIRI|nr:unnamed protein product [Adineta ricciae]